MFHLPVSIYLSLSVSLSLSFSLTLNSLKLDCGLSPFSSPVLHSPMLFYLLLISSHSLSLLLSVACFRPLILNVTLMKMSIKSSHESTKHRDSLEYLTSSCNYLTMLTRPFSEPLPHKCLLSELEAWTAQLTRKE